ncbi:hypothetical protein HYV86_04035 [Candidatus Woesearchaeota archaeon]|nr:hypothetical protein [Candidatus Woesearchaeota archaeon]
MNIDDLIPGSLIVNYHEHSDIRALIREEFSQGRLSGGKLFVNHFSDFVLGYVLELAPLGFATFGLNQDSLSERGIFAVAAAVTYLSRAMVIKNYTLNREKTRRHFLPDDISRENQIEDIQLYFNDL